MTTNDTRNQGRNNRALLDTHQAADYIGFSSSTLRWSRSTGTLAGVQTPEFLKIGKTVRYETGVLDQWLAQFESKPNTAA
ncbi:helix-turn-helix domain-containing protein [Marinobacterium sp. D7]|uniref:helix-turn-helix transcriptional regulator n=1 Tax=Marinobacterium ramblicola TaxID=2849041 RepID=UPI001C2DCA9F|nr:helix-turn-helix domain-containing protein [Marinobacterium ramblicola]MBV1788629.1 helix-turn-helix domain-containing protein [Marinobacterium ramblicola]